MQKQIQKSDQAFIRRFKKIPFGTQAFLNILGIPTNHNLKLIRTW